MRGASCCTPRAHMRIYVSVRAPGNQPCSDLLGLLAELLLLRRVFAGPAFLVGSLNLDEVPAVTEPREKVGWPVRRYKPHAESGRERDELRFVSVAPGEAPHARLLSPHH